MTLEDNERQKCEIWTRVCGYHRPKARFNVGKKQEHLDMLKYDEKVLLDRIADDDVQEARS